jgi:hypothetical protein
MAVTAAAVGALLLTAACGGGSDDSAGDDIPGVGHGEESPGEDESSEDPGSDEDTFFLRGIAKGITEQDPDHTAYKSYSTGSARTYGQSQIQEWVDGGWTMQGTDRYYDLSFRHVNEDVIGVQFCHDESQMQGRDVETGETVEGEEEEGGSLLFWTIVMTESVVDGFWQATGVTVERDASQCPA